MHQEEDLRRIERLHVCCRVDAHDRFGVWTAVTEDLSDRGCRLVTTKSPRLGSLVHMTLSSDLFAGILEVVACVEWVAAGRIGLSFVRSEGSRATPAEWVERLIDHGRVAQSGPRPVGAPRIVPVVQSASSAGTGGRDGVVVPLHVKRG